MFIPHLPRRPLAAALCLLAPLASAQTASPQVTALEDVVVTASRMPQAASDALGDVTVIDGETLRRAGQDSLAEILARQHGIAQTVVDCGVRRDFDAAPGLVVRKIAPSTADCSAGPAMTRAQCQQALGNGIALVKSLPGNALLLGEMGIGNTSPAALLAARLGGIDVAEVTGAGTGLDAEGVARKTAVLREALAANQGASEPLDVLAALGGFEIATMTGAVLQAAAERRVIVVDGFIASSAVLVAARLAPPVLQRCVFAHRSDERGHARLLQLLGAEPLLDMALRVGEGSGAALAWPLLESACRILNEMASFESAGVSDKA